MEYENNGKGKIEKNTHLSFFFLRYLIVFLVKTYFDIAKSPFIFQKKQEDKQKTHFIYPFFSIKIFKIVQN